MFDLVCKIFFKRLFKININNFDGWFSLLCIPVVHNSVTLQILHLRYIHKSTYQTYIDGIAVGNRMRPLFSNFRPYFGLHILGYFFCSLQMFVKDSDRNLDVVWRVFYNLMKDTIEACCNNPPKSPIRELLEMEPEKARFSWVSCWETCELCRIHESDILFALWWQHVIVVRHYLKNIK